MSEIKNGRLDLYVAEHLKCNHVMTLGFKGLMHKLTVDGVGTLASPAMGHVPPRLPEIIFSAHCGAAQSL